MESKWWPTIVTSGLAVLSIPVSYGYTLLCSSLPPIGMLVVAGLIMTGVVITNKILTNGKVKNKMYYGFALFAFTGIIDIILGLEIDGYAEGFLTLYLKHGEPYLVSAWGAVVSYWDGTVHLVCYLTMAYLSSNGKSYRTIGLHWSASILNSMIVLLLGACLSESGLGWCTVLNIPYVIFPLIVAIQCLSKPISQTSKMAAKSTLLDKGLIFLLIEASFAALLKGLATFSSKRALPSWYRASVEPILQENEPAPFAAVQGLISIFYFLPCYMAVAWGLFSNPGQKWLKDLTIILAGATLQAGGATFGMAFHHLTKSTNKLPPMWNRSAFWSFWAVNLLLCVVPQLVALRLIWLPTELINEKPKDLKTTNKTKKIQEKQKRVSKKVKEHEH